MIEVTSEFVGYIVAGFVTGFMVAVGGVLLRAIRDFFNGGVR